MIYLFMQRHGGADLLTSAMGKLSKEIVANYVHYFPENHTHPEDLVTNIKNIISSEKENPSLNRLIATHSLLVLFVLNNAMLADTNLQVKAFEVLEEGSWKDAIKQMTMPTNHLWIDEQVLGKIFYEQFQFFEKFNKE